VLRVKTHASESGQMHVQHPAICGQVIKKKGCTVSRPKCICGQRSKMASQGYTHSCYFLLQRYRSARQSPVQNGVLGLEKQLQIFHFLCLNMASLSLFQDGVSGVHKITRYNDEGLKRRENSLIFFPLEIKYMYEVYT